MAIQAGGSKQGGGRRVPTFRDNYIEFGNEDEPLHFERPLGGTEIFYLRVNSPDCDSIFRVRSSSNFDNRANCSFFARVYKPATTADHAVIIYNGLDETIFNQNQEELFKFYDDLGARLAQDNILAILLPTPYHMNRALAYLDAESEIKQREGNVYIDFTIPTEALMERNWNIYRNHFQGFKETIELCRRLRPELNQKTLFGLKLHPDAMPSRAATFLQEAVSSTATISLLGYSLGGLRALTEYLFDRYDARVQQREPLFTSCVAVNPSVALPMSRSQVA